MQKNAWVMEKDSAPFETKNKRLGKFSEKKPKMGGGHIRNDPWFPGFVQLLSLKKLEKFAANNVNCLLVQMYKFLMQ